MPEYRVLESHGFPRRQNHLLPSYQGQRQPGGHGSYLGHHSEQVTARLGTQVELDFGTATHFPPGTQLVILESS
jgi:hypothetical protein